MRWLLLLTLSIRIQHAIMFSIGALLVCYRIFRLSLRSLWFVQSFISRRYPFTLILFKGKVLTQAMSSIIRIVCFGKMIPIDHLIRLRLRENLFIWFVRKWNGQSSVELHFPLSCRQFELVFFWLVGLTLSRTRHVFIGFIAYCLIWVNFIDLAL